MFNKFVDIMTDVADKVDSNKYMQTIKKTFTVLMPFVLVGSFSSLFKALLCSKRSGLASFKAFQWLENLSPAFDSLYFITMSTMSIFCVFLIGFYLAKINKVNQVFAGLIALGSYIAVCPQTVAITFKNVTKTAEGLNSSVIGANGLFMGMFIGILSVEVYSFFSKIKAFQIKMPPEVPGAIATSFNNMFPILFTMVIFCIVGRVFLIATGSYLNDVIYTILQAPLQAAMNTPVGMILITFFMQFFWLIGIHGGLVISPIRNPLRTASIAKNIALANAGLMPTETFTFGFWTDFSCVGGAGATLSLIIAIFLFSKREDERGIAKVGFIPGIFSISEPIVFGLPLVMNMTYAIPFVLGSSIMTAIAQFFVKIGFIIPNIVDPPITPIGVSALISFGWQGVIVQLLCIATMVVVYAPFVKISNVQWKRKKEKEGKEAINAG